MSSVTAIVVSYETRDLLGRCLAALREEQVATVVVDNASRDGSASFVREHFPEATLVALDRNVGFAAGCNAGAAHAATPFLLLVNPDAAPRPGAVAALARLLPDVRAHGGRQSAHRRRGRPRDRLGARLPDPLVERGAARHLVLR